MVLASLGLTGCAAYHFGAHSLYPAHIRTVYVEIFDSNSFRSNLGEQLTEAVMKQIEMKTPYKVVDTPDADSRLTGRIVRDNKKVRIESPTDEPREVEYSLVVQATWTDREGSIIRRGAPVALDEATATVTGTGSCMPEMGSSLATAQQSAIDSAAEQIVSLMEAPW